MFPDIFTMTSCDRADSVQHTFTLIIMDNNYILRFFINTYYTMFTNNSHKDDVCILLIVMFVLSFFAEIRDNLVCLCSLWSWSQDDVNTRTLVSCNDHTIEWKN